METATNQEVLARFAELYHEVFAHEGYGDMRLEVKLLRRGQKEVIIHCGKQYRFVVDFGKGVPACPGKKDFSVMACGHADKEGDTASGSQIVNIIKN